MSDREIMNAKLGIDGNERSVVEILEKEYPVIYNGFTNIMEQQLEIFAKKHLDYGLSNIAAGTLLSTKTERRFALTGIWYRINDKVSRWKNLLINKGKENNEPLTDTYQDIVNYAIIAQLIDQGLWKK